VPLVSIHARVSQRPLLGRSRHGGCLRHEPELDAISCCISSTYLAFHFSVCIISFQQVFQFSMHHFMWSACARGRWAGAMRGAVSVALVCFYYDPDGGSVDAEKSTLIAMTLTVVLFSTLVFGAATKPLLDLMLGPDRARPRERSTCSCWQ